MRVLLRIGFLAAFCASCGAGGGTDAQGADDVPAVDPGGAADPGADVALLPDAVVADPGPGDALVNAGGDPGDLAIDAAGDTADEAPVNPDVDSPGDVDLDVGLDVPSDAAADVGPGDATPDAPDVPDAPDLVDAGPAPEPIAFVLTRQEVSATAGWDFDDDGNIDNMIGKNLVLAGVMNTAIAQAIQGGRSIVLAEVGAGQGPGGSGPASVSLYRGAVAGGLAFDATRDLGGQGVFTLDPAWLDPEGEAVVSIPGTLANGVFSGASAGPIALGLPQFQTLGDDPVPTVPLRNVHLVFTLGETGGLDSVTGGLLAGTLSKQELGDCLGALKDGGYDLPMEPNQILDMLGTPDFDSNGDDAPDAWTFGLVFDGISATLVDEPGG